MRLSRDHSNTVRCNSVLCDVIFVRILNVTACPVKLLGVAVDTLGRLNGFDYIFYVLSVGSKLARILACHSLDG